MSQTQIQAINDEAVEFLCQYYFNETITPKQAEIVRAIAYQKSKRIVACMMTRYGKTYSVAMGVLLYIIFNKNKKIGLIAPIRDQTAILRNYIADFSMRSPYFRELIEIDVKGIERLKREVSKIRITFRNGCSLQILSAEGTGNRLMGWGFDLVICVPHDSLVMTDVGQIKIKEIVEKKIKCKALSFNHETGLLEWKSILKYYSNGKKPTIKITCGVNSFESTGNHPVYVEGRGYIQAESVKVGDKVLGWGKDFKMFDGIINHGKMRLVRKRILQKTESHKKNKDKYLQSRMSRKTILETAPDKNSGMCELQEANKKVQIRCLADKELFLLKEVPRTILSRGNESKVQRKNIARVCCVQKNIRDNSCERSKVLFNEVQKQRTFAINDCGRKSCLEEWNRKRTIFFPVHKKTEIGNKKKVRQSLPVVQETIQCKLSMCSPYRLRQEKCRKKKSDSVMFQLSCEDKLQERALETFVVTKIGRGRTTSVYNLEVEGNNNYFVNGILTHNCDESCLIDGEVFRQKIFRMLGDNSESMLVEIGNPWNRNNHFIQHWNNPEFLKIKGDYKDALREGRTTQAFIDEQKSLLTGMEFKILYEAEFPEESEDSLLRGEWIAAAVNKKFEIRKILEQQTIMAPALFKEKYGDKPTLVTGVDVAEMGMDSTVAISAIQHNGLYEIFDISSWDKKDTNVTSGKVDLLGRNNKIETIGVDATGVGQGVYADLLALNWNVEEIKVGRSPKTEKAKLRFQNLKAEFYWNLRDLFEQGMISIPAHSTLLEQLRSMRYELTSARKIRIIDPEKSPDFADAIMLCVNTGRKRLIFDFI